ncbi:cyclin N-terminal domain-containing protein 2 [Esox lucius]|uniref:Cyclin N-terminal domain containing 2 n=1 Tax=Esox lucius TaxID=8010 RepID=A0A3P8ZZZ6_ESOLU|nr:cyclin N-terminal domain-containing protein 2 [Esox lucius]XP_019904131.1 cyclin N-terminal domain-containing protein 2 [Esox lucius]
MAKTGFCDSMPLLDLHKKTTEERRAPLRAWSNASGPKERWHPQEGEEQPRGVQQKTEPERRWVRRLPVSTEDGIIMGFHENESSSYSDGYKEDEAVLLYLHGLQGLHSLQTLVPGLLRHEMELAMEKLGLIYDRSYAWDVFSDMMRSQLRFTFPNADLPRPFTDTTRAILVDWLIQVHGVFHFSEETLYLSVHLLNRSLRQIKVNTANLQLLGVVCLFLAAKKEECLLPEVSELCFLMENSYSKRQLLRMERRVLTELKFEVSHSSPLHFLLLSASIAHCSTKVVWMARYLLELSLLEGQCVVFLAAQLAGAALCLARRILQEPPTPERETAWCIASSIHMGSEATLLKIMHIQAGAAARAQSRDTCATFLKFSTGETMHVSNHLALQSAPSLLSLTATHT